MTAENGNWQVLVVDAEEDPFEMLASLPQGLIAVHARTGAEARALLRRTSIAVAVLEYSLPDICGLELLRFIRREQPRIPVILLTGHGSEEICAMAFRLGAADYLVKPTGPQKILTSIHQALSMTGARRDLDARPRIPQRGLDDELIENVMARIQSDYSARITLTSLAAQLGVSRYSLCRRFKAAVKVSFRDYLLNARITRACALLKATNYTVTEVAQMVGFSELPRLDKMFKKVTGVPPSRYRALFRRHAQKDKVTGTKLLGRLAFLR